MAELAGAGTIDDVIDRMQAIADALPPEDGVAQFNRMYLKVTELVDAAVAGRMFRAGDFLARLDVVFANLFFAAYDAAAAGRPVPRAWRPLFDHRARPGVLPLQFAFAGMNAHIAHDLPIAVVATCEEAAVEPCHDSDQHQDFTSVNAVLAAASATVKGWFMTGLLAHLDHDAGRVDDAVEAFCLGMAREGAWDNAVVLWHLRGHEQMAALYRGGLERGVELTSRGLLL